MSLFKELYQFSEGKVELRALPSRRQAYFEIVDQAGIDEFCQQHKHEDCYFGVATRDGAGGKKENIVHFPALWADVDFKNTPREIAWDLLKKFPFKPSAIVKSGGGAHVYFFLKEPAEKNEWRRIEDANKRIAYALSADTGATDAARILRVPGTLNHKYDPPRRVVVSTTEKFSYTIEAFLEILPPVEDARRPTTRRSGTLMVG